MQREQQESLESPVPQEAEAFVVLKDILVLWDAEVCLVQNSEFNQLQNIGTYILTTANDKMMSIMLLSGSPGSPGEKGSDGPAGVTGPQGPAGLTGICKRGRKTSNKPPKEPVIVLCL